MKKKIGKKIHPSDKHLPVMAVLCRHVDFILECSLLGTPALGH